MLMDLVCKACGELVEDAVKTNMRIRVLSSDKTMVGCRVGPDAGACLSVWWMRLVVDNGIIGSFLYHTQHWWTSVKISVLVPAIRYIVGGAREMTCIMRLHSRLRFR